MVTARALPHHSQVSAIASSHLLLQHPHYSWFLLQPSLITLTFILQLPPISCYNTFTTPGSRFILPYLLQQLSITNLSFLLQHSLLTNLSFLLQASLATLRFLLQLLPSSPIALSLPPVPATSSSPNPATTLPSHPQAPTRASSLLLLYSLHAPPSGSCKRFIVTF